MGNKIIGKLSVIEIMAFTLPEVLVFLGLLLDFNTDNNNTITDTAKNFNKQITQASTYTFGKCAEAYVDNICGIVKESGQVQCWEIIDNRVEGTQEIVPCPKYTSTMNDKNKFSSMELNLNIVCGVTTEGKIVCEDISSYESWSSEGPYMQVSVGVHHYCGITENFILNCYKLNAPKELLHPFEKKFIAVSLGLNLYGAIGEDYRIFLWDKNFKAKE